MAYLSAVSLLLTALFGVSVFTAAMSDSFEIVQTYETEEEQTNMGLNSGMMAGAGTAGTAQVSISTGDALSGNASLAADIGNITTTWDFAAVSLMSAARAATLADVKGFFFRMRSENPQSAFLRVCIGTTGTDWGNDTFDFAGEMTFVSRNGTVTKGNVPARFDGYVFMRHSADVFNDKITAALKTGGCPLSVMFYGDGNAFGSSRVLIDNVGYFSETADYAALTAAIDPGFIQGADESNEGESSGGEAPTDDPFCMVQTFDTAESYDGNVALNSALANPFTSSVSHTVGDPALSGTGSVTLTVSGIDAGWDTVALRLMRALPRAAIVNPAGIFFRMKADNRKGADFRLSFSDTGISWGTDAFGMKDTHIAVDLAGNVYTGDLPENFDGYVFCQSDGDNRTVMEKLLKDGSTPLAVMFCGGENFGGSVVQIDNLGYYAATEDFAALAEMILAAYPENHEPRPPVQDPDYVMHNTFDTAEEQNNSGLNQEFMTANGTAGSAELSFITEKALFGTSLKAVIGNIETTWDYAAISLFRTAPKADIADLGGFFFRLKANNTEPCYLRLAMSNGAAEWGTTAFDLTDRLICVSLDTGKVTKGDVPAGFNGYVFINRAASGEIIRLLKTGGTPLSVLFYGDNGTWANKTLLIDNVGYFKSLSENDNYAVLVKKLLEEYPEEFHDPGEDDDPYKDLSDDPYFMVNPFDTDEDYGKAGINRKVQAYGTGTTDHMTAYDAVSGKGSMRVLIDSISTAWDFVAVNMHNSLPASPIKNLGGVFFRLKSNNPAGVYLRGTFGVSPLWGENTFDMQCETTYAVDLEGNVYQKDLPQNFDGYVFLRADDSHQAAFLRYLYEGGTHFAFMFYGTGSFSDTVNYVDNFGYFAQPADAAGYAALVQKIMKDYPDNNYAPKKIRLYHNNALDSSSAAEAAAGLKVKLTAKVSEEVTSRAIVWSVITGAADIVSLDEGTQGFINAQREHSCLIDFLDSGTVVIRATLKYQPEVYEEFTYTVTANASVLRHLIDQLKAASGSCTADGEKLLADAVAAAEKVLADERATHKDYLAQAIRLRDVAAKLGIPLDDAEASLTVNGTLLDAGGREMTGCTVQLDGEKQDSRFTFEEVTQGRHVFTVYDADGALRGEYAFTLIAGDAVAAGDHVLYVTESTARITLCLELAADGTLSVVQFSESTEVSGSADGNGGETPSPATGEESAADIAVLAACLAAGYLLVRRRRNTFFPDAKSEGKDHLL